MLIIAYIYRVYDTDIAVGIHKVDISRQSALENTTGTSIFGIH